MTMPNSGNTMFLLNCIHWLTCPINQNKCLLLYQNKNLAPTLQLRVRRTQVYLSFHYTDVKWAQWRLKSPVLRLFIQPCIQAQIKEDIKAPRQWYLWGEFTGDRWNPRTNVQWHGKCFHLMTSSWFPYSQNLLNRHGPNDRHVPQNLPPNSKPTIHSAMLNESWQKLTQLSPNRDVTRQMNIV